MIQRSAWPHAGFGAHIGPVIAGEDRQSLLRVARYGARAPIAEDRLRYHSERAEIELVSDAASGPYVGVLRMGFAGYSITTTRNRFSTTPSSRSRAK